jgi:hypothetical protein
LFLLETLKLNYANSWNHIFDFADIGDLEKPLNNEILTNPSSEISKHIMYLYSMESFLCHDLSQACSEKNDTKIEYYAPFANAVSQIIHSANSNLQSGKLTGSLNLYIGLKMSEADT